MTDTALTTTEPQRPKTAIAVGGNVGALIPQDIEQAFRIAQALAHSGMTPQGFKTPETCFVAIMAGAELGLPPFQSLQSFAIINNRPTLWGDALVAVVRTNGFKLREWYEGEGDTLTAFCEVTRPDNGDTAEASFSVDDAKTAGLWKKSGPWSSNPKRMLKMRARAFAIRDGAADVLRGFQIREEVEDYGDAIAVETPKTGTGLLAKLQSTETLAEEGFGIRNLADEAGEAAPAAEPKKRGRPPKAKSVAQEALDAIADAEPEIVQHVLEDHGHPLSEEELAADRAARTRSAMRFWAAHGRKATADDFEGNEDPENPTPLLDSDVGRSDDLLGRVVTQDDVDSQYGPTYAENLPADAEVEETAPVTPEPAQEPSAGTGGEVSQEGHAEPGEVYFLASEPAFASGRRACYRDGLPLDSVDDGTHPVYSEHAPRKGSAPKQAENDPSEPEDPTTAGFDTGAELDPFQTFEAALTAAKSWPDLRPAIAELSKSPEWKARPDDVRRVRCDVWDLVGVWNEAGAKLDPVDDAFLFQAYVTATDDAEAIEGTLALVQDSDWYKAASPEMQAGVGRFVLNRVAAIRGA